MLVSNKGEGIGSDFLIKKEKRKERNQYHMNEQTILVATDGSGQYTSIQEAIYSIPDKRDYPVTIFLKPGIYEEKVFIRKENINMIGSAASETIIRYGDGAKTLRRDGSEYGTFNSATVMFAGSDLFVENLTFENCAGNGRVAGQALAVYVASDRTVFKNCRFLGHQDTIFVGDLNPGAMKHLMLPEDFLNSTIPIYYEDRRNYFDSCFICGDVDYIFGPNTAYFSNCEIFSRKLESESGSFITAASTPATTEYGFVFYQCKLTSDDKESSVYLGRPWRDYAKTAFLCCEMGPHIKPEGWDNWGKVNAEVTTAYIEYNNYGKGASYVNENHNQKVRVPFSKQLTNDALLDYYSLSKVLGGKDQWQPLI